MFARPIAVLFALALTLLTARPSSAGVARVVSLAELVKASDLVAIGTPVDSYSLWETVGNRRRIVTYTRVRIDETVGTPRTEPELLVRTLGGQVGTIGQIVHGEPVVAIGHRAMIFVRRGQDGTARVTARTQGYYPLSVDSGGALRLARPPAGAHLVGTARDPSGSAMERLVGLTTSDATRLVLSVMRP
jgi:hypothetical protein